MSEDEKARFWREFKAARTRHDANLSKPVVTTARLVTRAECVLVKVRERKGLGL